jgi:hypothetical protein
MAINFNVSPYFDDFDPSKNFHRILFKPGFAVQARELSQSQSILQGQISNFADAIFKQNTPISGGKVTTNLNCYYIKLNTTYSGSIVTASDFLNNTITNDNGDVIAKVIATDEGVAGGDPPTLVVTYLSGLQFQDSDVINSIDNLNLKATTITSGSTGKSSAASISTGIFYVVNGYSQSQTKNPDGSYNKYSVGNFVTVLPQTIILDKYSNIPTYRIGLQITETIYDYINDSSLLDPAIGSNNYQAPGADRFVITLTLSTTPLINGTDEAFIELVRIENGSIVKQVNSTVYSTIDDYFAKRDYESNGDYVVEDFKLRATSNLGVSQYYSGPVVPGDPNKYDMHVGKGIAYVHGYRIENQGDYVITGNRARETKSIAPNDVFIDYGNYFAVDNVKGSFDLTLMPTVDLHCVDAASINSANSTTYNSTLVGTAYLRNLDYQSSIGANTQSYVFNMHVSEITGASLSGNTVSGTTNTITFENTAKFAVTNVAYIGAKLSIKSGLSQGDTRYITSYNGTTRTATVNQPFTITPDNTTKFILTFPVETVESIVQKNGSFVLTSKANINAPAGKTNGIYSGDTILYNPGNPEMIFRLGYPFVANTNNSNYSSTQVFRNQGFNSSSNTMTISSNEPIHFKGTIGSPISGDALKQLFTIVDTNTGNILDFSVAGNTATLTSATSVTFAASASSNYGSITSGIDVIASVFVSNGEDSLVRKTKTLITGNTSFVETSTVITADTSMSLDGYGNPLGQTLIKKSVINFSSLPLYVSDVKKITKIIDTGDTNIAPTGSLSSYSDITTSFIFDNGQTDTSYQFSTIKLKPGLSLPKGDILVVYDYYLTGGGDGYYSVDSYLNESYSEIPTYKAKDGIVYNLRDCVDFRPSRKNAQASFAWNYKNSASASHGTLIPNDLSDFQNDYNYYLGRKDKLVLTKDSKFLLIEGTPAVNPKLPTEPEGSLVLANLTLDPYTAILPGQFDNLVRANMSINKVVHKRWTKSDISDLQKQVDNLEYYTSLSLLEQNAQAMQVPDVNGLNRFKNGILVDDFSSFGVVDTGDQNFSANINIRKKQMWPLHDVNNFQLQNPEVMNSLGTLKATNTFAISSLGGTTSSIFTLPYTTKTLISQTLSSNTISINPFDVCVYEGIASMNPPVDVWCNTQETPAILISDPIMQINQAPRGLTFLNVGDYQSIPGTPMSTSGKDNVLVDQSTYASQSMNFVTAESSTATALGMTTNNGYVQNNGILPFIRPQQIIVRCKGMLVNTPVKCFFDDQRVENYLESPSTIELTNVTGTFNDDDIVGFYVSASSTFYPVARVVTVYRYPNSSKVRLYIATMVGAPGTLSSNQLVNATFDATGAYKGSSASGTVNFSGSSIISIHTGGTVASAGGTFTSSVEPTPKNLFKAYPTATLGTFMNNYGVWGDQNGGSSYDISLPLEIDIPGNYTLNAQCTGSGTLYIDGVSKLTLDANYKTLTLTGLTKGIHTVRWVVSSSYTTYGTNAVAVIISDADGNQVFSSVTPPGVTYANVGTEYKMPGGASFFVGATKIQLSKDASLSSNVNFYAGSTITVKSTYVYSDTYGAVYVPKKPVVGGDGDAGWQSLYNTEMAAWQPKYDAAADAKKSTVKLAATKTQSATIIHYDAVTRTVTLSEPVDVSLGSNDTYGILNSTYSIRGTTNNIATAINKGTGLSKFATDESGSFTCIFNVPGSVFYQGQRVFRVDNRILDSDKGASATTFAEAVFNGSSLQNISSTNFSPSVDSTSKNYTPLFKQTYNIISHSSPLDPLAQSFIVSKDKYPNGVFLNSVKLFFARKPTTTNSPVRLSIVGTLNGYPNGQTLDYSRVNLTANDVKVSATPHYLDPNSYTEFKFSAPVYVQPDVLYALVVESTTSDYQLYVGEQNQPVKPLSTSAATPGGAVLANAKIGGNPYVGSLFESQNALTWTAEQSKDLMFTIEQCVFDITKQPTITFLTPRNLPFRKMPVEDILHRIDPNSVNNIHSHGILSRIPLHSFNLTTTDFVPSLTKINYTYSTTLTSDQSITDPVAVYPGKFGTPLPDNVYLSDGKGERILMNDSNNSFQMFATLSSSDPNVSPILSDDGITLYQVGYHINNMGMSSKVISVANTGTGYNVQSTVVNISDPDIGNDKAILDFTANTTTGGIENVFVTYPGSGYLKTPTITVVDAATRSGNANASIVVYGETSASGGNGYNHYITKKVVMTPGNDSGDLRVYYTAYKPLNSDVYVYYKILNSNDTENLEDQNWQLMTQVKNPSVYSKDRNDIIEFEWAPGTLGQADNVISYTNNAGITYNSFIQFAIKVVMATSDNTNVPFLTDIRALALPSGTGT